MKAKETEITRLKYYKDIGLVGTSFMGEIKIFDPFSFAQIWRNTNKTRESNTRTNIVTFDVSQSLGLMATGGAEGRLLLVDPLAYGITNGTLAHLSREIIGVYIYSEQ
jgi:hypothetical protein